MRAQPIVLVASFPERNKNSTYQKIISQLSESKVNQALKPAILGAAVAIAITTTMDATGYSMFSALPLFPLAGLFWYLQKFSRREIGLVWGNLRTNVLALGYPVLVLGLMGTIAWMMGNLRYVQSINVAGWLRNRNKHIMLR